MCNSSLPSSLLTSKQADSSQLMWNRQAKSLWLEMYSIWRQWSESKSCYQIALFWILSRQVSKNLSKIMKTSPKKLHYNIYLEDVRMEGLYVFTGWESLFHRNVLFHWDAFSLLEAIGWVSGSTLKILIIDNQTLDVPINDCYKIKNISNLGFLCDDDTVAHLILLPEVPETTRSL